MDALKAGSEKTTIKWATVLLLCPFFLSAQVDLNSSAHPIVIIDTDGQEIVDDPRIVAHMGVIDNGPGNTNNIDDPFNDYDGRIAIELRGSSSSLYPKKQYRLETQDAAGENLNIPLMGLPEENDWILYGPYDDQSMIRNVLAFDLSREIGRYASRTHFCELVLNEDYRGLYVLMEKLKRDDNRVDIANLRSVDTTGLQLTGGYLIKIDKYEGENLGGWTSSAGTPYQYDDPGPDELVDAQKSYIQNYMEQLESAFAHNDDSYLEYVDLNAAVDHFLLNEISKNTDAYRISAFMYKDRDDYNPRLVFGPLWDFNLSFGKAWYAEDEFLTEGWQTDYTVRRPWDGYRVPFYWEEITQNTTFMSAVRERWGMLRHSTFAIDSLFKRIDMLSVFIEEARIRNFERWPDNAPESYEEEVTRMKAWLKARIEWMDGELDYVDSISGTNGEIETFRLLGNFPNPFNASTTIRWEQPRQAAVSIKVYDSGGRLIEDLGRRVYGSGTRSVRWQAASLASGVYFYRLKTKTFSQTGKMLLLR